MQNDVAFSKFLVFPKYKNKRPQKVNKDIYFFKNFGTRQELTLLLCILIQMKNQRSCSSNFGKTVWKLLLIILDIWEVNRGSRNV